MNGGLKNKKTKFFIKSGTPDEFYAPRCLILLLNALKFQLKLVIIFSKPEKKFPKNSS
jgi:hypothetical protein